MKKSLLALLATTTALAAFSAQANDRWPRWYVGISGDVSYLQDADLDGSTSGETEHDTGHGFNLALGYLPAYAAPFNNLRFEAEFGYHTNDVDNASFGATSASANGDVTAKTYMFNTYYDFSTPGSRYTPYIGAGIGVADVELDVSNAAVTIRDSENVFAYQGMAGISYAPVTLPRTEWSLGYRYLGTADPGFTTSTGVNVDSEYNNHSVEVGGRFRF